jgi:hypothetical protein
LGRFYAVDNKSIIPISKHIKHTIFKYLNYLDLDQTKGHATIANSVGDLNGKDFKYINKLPNDLQQYVTISNPATEKSIQKLRENKNGIYYCSECSKCAEHSEESIETEVSAGMYLYIIFL